MNCRQMADLHARCFTVPRPWPEAAFRSLLSSPGCFLRRRPDAFLVGRAVAGEAELLTLAVAPEGRRHGLGRALVEDFAATSRAMGADNAFLEVADDNAAALALYRACGWRQAGLRRGYYARGLDAVVLRLALAAGQEPG